MEIYKLKWTRLQNEILRFLSIKSGSKVNQRTIAKSLEVSPTAVSKALKELKNSNLISIEKSNMNLILIELNREEEKVINFKRIENLKIIYESGLVRFLEDNFPGSVIILFGSYSYGEDTINSDIDVAIIGCKEKKIDLTKLEKIFEKEIRINFYDDFKEINNNLKSNIFNGIVLSGRIGL
jgi:predicted nucleotidyltransferase